MEFRWGWRCPSGAPVRPYGTYLSAGLDDWLLPGHAMQQTLSTHAYSNINHVPCTVPRLYRDPTSGLRPFAALFTSSSLTSRRLPYTGVVTLTD